MDFLAERVKLKKFVVTGVCSGARRPRVTGRCDEPRTAGVMLLNPRTFCINDLRTITTYQQARWYRDRSSGRSPGSSSSGATSTSRGRSASVAPKVEDVVLQQAKRAAVDGLLGVHVAAARPRIDSEADVPKLLHAMAGAVSTFLLVTKNDPGVEYLESNSAPGCTCWPRCRPFPIAPTFAAADNTTFHRALGPRSRSRQDSLTETSSSASSGGGGAHPVRSRHSRPSPKGAALRALELRIRRRSQQPTSNRDLAAAVSATATFISSTTAESESLPARSRAPR